MVLRDLDYEFVMTDNTGVLITDKIEGYLEAFIFETSKPLKFDAQLLEFPLSIWNETNINGGHFVLIRYESLKNSENRYNYQYERFPLLNQLKFMFKGQRGTKVRLTVRYDSNA